MTAPPAEPIRIGYVIGQLCHGGAERQLFELARHLDRARFRPFVYVLSDVLEPYGPLLEREGVPVCALPRTRHLELGRVRALARAFRADRIDVVHAFLFGANPYAWAAARWARVPRVITSARNCHGLGRVRDWANRLAFRGSDAIVCNGEAVRAFVRARHGAPAGRIAVIYNGVDAARFTPAAPAAGASGRPPVVITVGRLVPQKDLALFLDAAALLRRQRPDTRFVIVGDGPARAALERRAAEAGLADAVTFTGERSDVPELVRAADVFWLTSAWEGLPNVVLEAAACGTPVVARDVGAAAEVVEHGVTGFLVPGRDAAAFARHTAALLGDPHCRCSMGAAARALVERRFSVEQMAAETQRLYERVAEGIGGLERRWRRDASLRHQAVLR